ncbi:MAG: bicarbonate transport system substrate-binding protein [Thermosynechococcus sp.]|uniref:CmpA/NrtA family ABC transporter substrate-binding protein n=1 Tax=Thermosynechococcus sp. TaxID=2814275 RepID=UPI0021FF92CA|nr:CmpA/NrtA family ABC transporter substrate-binding protein [Thermosynechococcus sp.]BCX11306.1 MAG: bicarbonate transport system substrate-binding protein [Thermosynechococcus sp.]
MSQLSRRRFLMTATATAVGAIALKGCAPAQSPQGQQQGGGTAADVETDTIKLGFIPIVESAPLIIAKEKGFFAKHGLANAQLAKQANWASARDNVVIGSAGGGIDGGQWQMPMPHLISEGIITLNNQKVPMYLLAQLNTQGNGIAISGANRGKGIHLKIADPNYIKDFAAKNGRKFKAAYTFPQVNQDLWIRYWFAANGIDPDRDIDLLAVPPAETVAGMRNGTMDAFSTGDPWPFRIVSDDIGFMATLTAQMWPYHPEEYLAVRADWVDKHPKATKALLKAVIEAQQWCDDKANRPELIQICSRREYFNVPGNILTPPYEGTYTMGDGQPNFNDFNIGPLYWRDPNGNSVSFPYKSHDLWFLTENLRWGFNADKLKDFDNIKQIIDRVNRADLWREAAKELGIPAADIPSSDSRGVETFFDGVKFDPDNPQAYLNSLKIKVKS